MTASVALTTPGNIPHPLFPYEDMESAIKAIERAIKSGLFSVPEHGVTVLTGPGTIFKAIAEDWQEPTGQPEDAFYLVVQTPFGAQFPPFGFKTKAQADNTILEFSVKGYAVLRGVPEDKEVTYIQGVPGMVVLLTSREAFEARLKAARDAEVAKAAKQQAPAPRIIIPR